MKENTFMKSDKTDDIRMMTDFKDELERIKQKLAKDFTKYSELEKMKNKQKISGRALIFRKNENNDSSEEKDIKEINNNIIFQKIIPFEDLNFKHDLDKDNENKPKKNFSNDYINSDIINNNKYKNISNKFSSINTHNLNPINYN